MKIMYAQDILYRAVRVSAAHPQRFFSWPLACLSISRLLHLKRYKLVYKLFHFLWDAKHGNDETED